MNHQKNIRPVIISTVTLDGTTLGPNKRKRNQPGRPRVKQIRYCSKFEKPAEDSTISGKLCTRKGHNQQNCPDKHLTEATLQQARQTNSDPADVAAAIDPGYARTIM